MVTDLLGIRPYQDEPIMAMEPGATRAECTKNLPSDARVVVQVMVPTAMPISGFCCGRWIIPGVTAITATGIPTVTAIIETETEIRATADMASLVF